jgi:acetyl-CoA C-acetyltransferase
MNYLKNKPVYIQGAYQTHFGELWEKSFGDLLVEAGQRVLKEARMEPGEIEAVFVGSMLSERVVEQGHLGAFLSSELGLNCPAVRIEAACASGGMAIRQGFLSLQSGLYQTVLVVGVEKMTDACTPEVTAGLMGATNGDEGASGFTFPALYALMAKAYQEKYGLTDQELAAVAVKNHYHGSLNNKAHFNQAVSLAQVLASDFVCEPLRLFDCSGITDGAAAAVLSTKKGPVEIIGSGVATDSLTLSGRKKLFSVESTKGAMKSALKMAGIKREAIDLVEVHDCFTIAEIIALEDLGFYSPGRGRKAALKRETYFNRQLPVNTSGGLKACGHPVGATGVKQVVEVVTQLKEKAGQRQVKKAEIGLCHNVGGSGGTAVIHLLARN